MMNEKDARKAISNIDGQIDYLQQWIAMCQEAKRLIAEEMSKNARHKKTSETSSVDKDF